MYCYTVVSNIMCVLRELEMWTEISSEHHTFILKIAKLTNKKIDRKMRNRIKESQQNFDALLKEASNQAINYKTPTTPYIYKEITENTMELLNNFLNYDKILLAILQDLSEIGKRDKVWQTFLGHITEEQTYMFRLFNNLLRQL